MKSNSWLDSEHHIALACDVLVGSQELNRQTTPPRKTSRAPMPMQPRHSQSVCVQAG